MEVMVRSCQLVWKSWKSVWKPLVDASQLDRQGRWMSTTQDGKPCFMFSQEDAVPAFFDHAALTTLGWSAVTATAMILGLLAVDDKRILPVFACESAQ